MTFTPSDFDEWLGEGEFDCKSCKKQLSVEGAVVKCYLCDSEAEYFDLSHLPLVMDERCAACAGHPSWDADFYTLVIAGSWTEEFMIYDWTRNGKQIADLERTGRTDYWEGLVHFCGASEFISIYKDRRIRASSTGYYKKAHPEKSRAVCLTEAVQSNWNELKSRFGEYGFVFRKRKIVELGGAPAIYLPQSVLDEMKSGGERIPPTMWPYLNKLQPPSTSSGTKHDFLHEREWRVPKDIDFRRVRPYAVIFPKRRPGIEEEELILHAAREFQELTDRGGISADDTEIESEADCHPSEF
jgi:hypothetical protein